MHKRSVIPRTSPTRSIRRFLHSLFILAGLILAWWVPFRAGENSNPFQIHILVEMPGGSPEEINEKIILPLEKQLSASVHFSSLNCIATSGTATIQMTFTHPPDNEDLGNVYSALHASFQNFPKKCPFPKVKQLTGRNVQQIVSIPPDRTEYFLTVLSNLPGIQFQASADKRNKYTRFVLDKGWLKYLLAGGFNGLSAQLPDDSISIMTRFNHSWYPLRELGSFRTSQTVPVPMYFNDGQPRLPVTLLFDPQKNTLITDIWVHAVIGLRLSSSDTISDDLQEARSIRDKFVYRLLGLDFILMLILFARRKGNYRTFWKIVSAPFIYLGYAGWIYFVTGWPLTETALPLLFGSCLIFSLIQFIPLIIPESRSFDSSVFTGTLFITGGLIIVLMFTCYPVEDQPILQNQVASLMALLFQYIKRGIQLSVPVSAFRPVAGLLAISLAVLCSPVLEYYYPSEKGTPLQSLLFSAEKLPTQKGKQRLILNGILPPGYSYEEARSAAARYELRSDVVQEKLSLSRFNNQWIIHLILEAPLPYLRIVRQKLTSLATQQGGINWTVSGVGRDFYSKNNLHDGGYTVTLEGYDLEELKMIAEKQTAFLNRQPRVENARTSIPFWQESLKTDALILHNPQNNFNIYPARQITSWINRYQLINRHSGLAVFPPRSEFPENSTVQKPPLPVIRRERNYSIDISFTHYGSEKYANHFFEQYKHALEISMPPGFALAPGQLRNSNKRPLLLSTYCQLLLFTLLLIVVQGNPISCALRYGTNILVFYSSFLLLIHFMGWTLDQKTLFYLPLLSSLLPAWQRMTKEHPGTAVCVTIPIFIGVTLENGETIVLLYCGMLLISFLGCIPYADKSRQFPIRLKGR